MEEKKIENRIKKIKIELSEINEMRPGSLSKQFNVCGKANCSCKDPDNPQKHGPYYQLSYVHGGRSTSQFIKPEFVEKVEMQLANYKLFKKLTAEWVTLALGLAKEEMNLAKINLAKKK